MIDINSGDPVIAKTWNLNAGFSEQEEITPVINVLNLNDMDGNFLKGETNLHSVILNGKVQNLYNLLDLYVHLNDKKVFLF